MGAWKPSRRQRMAPGSWLLTGAGSRILLLDGLLALPLSRPTEDLDFGVMVREMG